MNDVLDLLADSGGSLRGSLRVPGDKSISHRAIMLASLAEGVSEVSGFLEGEDSLATLRAFTDMGVHIEGPRNGQLRVHGVGLHGLQAPQGPLDLGNSGTSMRLMAGLMSGQAFASELHGDASLMQRPMARVVDTAATDGSGHRCRGWRQAATADQRWQATAGNGVHDAGGQRPGEILSAVGRPVCARGNRGAGTGADPRSYRAHADGFRLPGRGGWTEAQSSRWRTTAAQQTIDVPADISSAAFFLVAASIAPGSDLLLEHVGINPTRTGVIDILRQMGADYRYRCSKRGGW